MRVALFGGSFNPIHLGHLRAAEDDREAMGLDLIYFIPAASPPHKPSIGMAPAEHRLQMVRLATKGNRYFMVSDVEVRRGGSSFTIDTVRYFRATIRAQELYLIMGRDQFEELETWKEADELTRLCSLIVHTRSSESQSGAEIPVATLSRFGYALENGSYLHPSGHTLSLVSAIFLPISATLIRRKVAAGNSVRYLVPSDVAEYIERHSLY